MAQGNTIPLNNPTALLRDQVRTKFDNYLESSFDNLAVFCSPDLVTKARGQFAQIQQDLQDLAYSRYVVQASIELTETGKQARLAAIEQEAASAAARWAPARETLADIEAGIKAAEDAADGGLVRQGEVGYVKRPPLTAEEASQQHIVYREIRDLARKLKGTEVIQKYLAAVEDGSDPDFVKAIETAPRAFPLVPDSVRQNARELRMEKSPWAARYKELLNEKHLYDTFLAAADLSLKSIINPRWMY